MKRIICLLLCLVMLAGCTAVPAETTGPVMETEPARVISEEATVVYPQTGEYQETALMANVPDQGTPLLLSVRSDGSVDYIYTEPCGRTTAGWRSWTPTPPRSLRRLGLRTEAGGISLPLRRA